MIKFIKKLIEEHKERERLAEEIYPYVIYFTGEKYWCYYSPAGSFTANPVGLGNDSYEEARAEAKKLADRYYGRDKKEQSNVEE
jgi:hypothetical protein